MPITGLALWEIPISGTAEDARNWTAEFTALLEAGDHQGALEYFSHDIPPEVLEPLKESAIWQVLKANIQSQRADAEALAWFHSAPLQQLTADVNIPILAMVGEETSEDMHDAAATITQLPNAQKLVVPGKDHQWEVLPMAKMLVEFVSNTQP